MVMSKTNVMVILKTRLESQTRIYVTRTRRVLKISLAPQHRWMLFRTKIEPQHRTW